MVHTKNGTIGKKKTECFNYHILQWKSREVANIYMYVVKWKFLVWVPFTLSFFFL